MRMRVFFVALVIILLPVIGHVQQQTLLRDIYVDHETSGMVLRVDESSPKELEATIDLWISSAGDVGIGTQTIGAFGTLVVQDNTVAATRAIVITGSYAYDSVDLLNNIGSGGLWHNADKTVNNYSSLQFSSLDSLDVARTFGHIASVFADHTAGTMDADFAFVLMEDGNLGEAMRLRGGGKLDLRDATDQSHTLTLEVPDIAGNLNFRFPSACGTSGYRMMTDGSCNTSWDAPAYYAVIFNSGTMFLAGAAHAFTDTGPAVSQEMASFIYLGSSIEPEGTPSDKFTIYATENGIGCGTDPTVEIYDITNAAQLATVTVTQAASGFYEDTSFTNVPAGQARMKVRATTAANCTLTISEITWVRYQ